MKTIIALILVASASVSYAENLAQDGVAMFTEQANGNYLLGRTFLDESDASDKDSDNDTFALPECSSNKNAWIDGIRLRASHLKPNGTQNLDALIKKMVIVFGNGQALTVTPNKNEAWLKVSKGVSDGWTVDFGAQRCVRSVTVLGEQWEAGKKANPSVVDVVGVVHGER